MFVWVYLDYCSLDGGAFMGKPVVFKHRKDAKAYMDKKIEELFEELDEEEVDGKIERDDYVRFSVNYHRDFYAFMIKKTKVIGL